MFKSGSIKELAGALLKAQKAMGNAALNSRNPHYNSTYADLPSVREAVLKPWNDNGIVIAQVPTISSDGLFQLMTVLMHAPSGEFLAGEYLLPTGRPQEIGSALTYARRYSAAAMAFIASDEDDDANIAEGKPAKIVERPAKAANDNTPFEKLSPQLLPQSDNMMDWATRFAAQLNAATGPDESQGWWQINSPVIAEVQKLAPKVYQRLASIYREKLGDQEPAIAVDQRKKTSTTTTTTTKLATADDFEPFRKLLLETETAALLDVAWLTIKPWFNGLNQTQKDQAVDMLEARRQQLLRAA